MFKKVGEGSCRNQSREGPLQRENSMTECVGPVWKLVFGEQG